MIVAKVEFALPRPVTPEQARETFLSTAPRYLDMPGVIRKYYLLSEDGSRAGGIYLWSSREDADRVYTDAWKAFVRDKYGTAPELSFLECPVVVDNVAHGIIAGA